ncbi:MAG: MogA/MoaB family molybdenum cofactor biosynthesis protein [Nitriliruptorales bacterium]|nr:MogA/MoaB family molybdenum cofactor biosynthesis protein [Nitriliruptorales bacterium]
MRRADVITISTRAAAGVYADDAGPAVAEVLRGAGFLVGDVRVVPDGRAVVATELRDACEQADLVVTTGGTGLHPRDETPEATSDIIDRPVPGISEAMRSASLQITPMAMLSRGTAGIRGTTLVINLPGSPKAAVENLHAIVPVLGHAMEQLAGGDHDR